MKCQIDRLASKVGERHRTLCDVLGAEVGCLLAYGESHATVYRMPILLAVLLSVQAEWKSRGEVDGITLETRTVPETGYEFVRVRASTKTPPAKQFAVIWGVPGIESNANKKAVKVHEVILDKPDERIVYQVVSGPLISDRDFVVRRNRRVDGEVYEVRWVAIDHPRYPPVADKVRAPRVEGSTVVEPSGDGGSIVTYEIYTDLGGSLPAWVAKGPMRDSALEWMKVMLARGAKE